MGTNFHVAWIDGTTRFRTSDMNIPLAALDRGITFIKNNIITTDGQVTYNSGTGVLTWAAALHFYFNNTTGIATHNTIAASNITLADNEFCYCVLSEINDATLTMQKASITTGLASNYLAYNILVLGYRNTTGDNLFGAMWALVNRSIYVEKALYDANTIVTANTDNTPIALTIDEERLVGRITGGSIAALTAAQVKTFIGLSTVLADYVTKALYDANTILAANTDNTPAAITISEQQVVGRITGGNIKGLSTTELRSLVGLNWSATPSTDHIVEGNTLELATAQTTSFGDVCRINASGTMSLAKADTIDNAFGLFICAEINLATAATGTFLIPGGIIRDDSWNWNVGSPIFLSTTGTSGNTLTQVRPSGVNNAIQILGIATHADRMFFYPQLVIVEHV